MRIIIATTDVLAHETRMPRGTRFVVTPVAKAGVTPAEIDPRTANAWISNGWATEAPAETPKAKALPDAG